MTEHSLHEPVPPSFSSHFPPLHCLPWFWFSWITYLEFHVSYLPRSEGLPTLPCSGLLGKILFILKTLNAKSSSFVMFPAAKSLQSCPTLCDPIDGSPPGSPVPGILQAITLEWVAIAFSNTVKWKVKVKSLSHVQFFATPWTAAYQAPPSMGFSRQEY